MDKLRCDMEALAADKARMEGLIGAMETSLV